MPMEGALVVVEGQRHSLFRRMIAWWRGVDPAVMDAPRVVSSDGTTLTVDRAFVASLGPESLLRPERPVVLEWEEPRP